MAGKFFVTLPARRPQRGGLLAVASVIEETTGRSAMGIDFVSDTCLPPVFAPGDCWADYEPVDGTKKVGVGIDTAEGKTLAIYAGVECFAHEGDDFAERAERALVAGQGIAIEKAVFEYLSATATAPVAATTLIDALAQAEAAAGVMPFLATMHASRRLVTHLHDATVFDGTAVSTKQGTPIANGGGYDDSTGATGASIIVSGPVTIWLGPITITRTIEHTENRTLAIAERTVSFAVECSVLEFATTVFPEETP